MTDIKLIGSRLTKINSKRDKDFKGKVTLKTNIKIIDFEIVKESKDSMKVEYNFKVDYGELGFVELEGLIFLSAPSKTIKSLKRSWNDKKFDTEDHILITNLIVKKATIKVIELEDELGLPIHMRLPSLTQKKR